MIQLNYLQCQQYIGAVLVEIITINIPANLLTLLNTPLHPSHFLLALFYSRRHQPANAEY